MADHARRQLLDGVHEQPPVDGPLHVAELDGEPGPARLPPAGHRRHQLGQRPEQPPARQPAAGSGAPPAPAAAGWAAPAPPPRRSGPGTSAPPPARAAPPGCGRPRAPAAPRWPLAPRRAPPGRRAPGSRRASSRWSDAGRAAPRAAVPAQVEGEAVEPGRRQHRRQRVALHPEVERLAVHGDAVDQQHRGAGAARPWAAAAPAAAASRRRSPPRAARPPRPGARSFQRQKRRWAAVARTRSAKRMASAMDGRLYAASRGPLVAAPLRHDQPATAPAEPRQRRAGLLSGARTARRARRAVQESSSRVPGFRAGRLDRSRRSKRSVGNTFNIHEVRREEGRSHHQAVQAGRGEAGALRDRRRRPHRHRGEGLRPPEGAHRALPRRRVRRGLPPQGEGRGGGVRRRWSPRWSRPSSAPPRPAASATARSSSCRSTR